MRVYVISLPQCKLRRQSIEANLQQLKLEYEIFSAIDGNCLSEQHQKLVQTQDKVLLSMAGGRQLLVEDKLSNGEIGCALSHLHVYQKILDSQDEYACVLEDDCILTEHFIEAMQSLDKLPADWDLVNFSYHIGLRNWPWAKKYYFGSSNVQYFQRVGLYHPTLNAIFNRRRFLCMAVAYIIKRNACNQLIKLGYPVRLTADYLMGVVAYNQLKIFRPFPMKDYYMKLQNFPSTIDEERPQHKMVRL